MELPISDPQGREWRCFVTPIDAKENEKGKHQKREEREKKGRKKGEFSLDFGMD